MGADIVLLLGAGYGAGSNNCGAARQMDQVGNGHAAFAFGVVDAANGCDTLNTVAHEMGHIASLRHDWRISNNTGSPFAYNHGYVSTLGQFTTVMAYNDPGICLLPCTPILHWSNPFVSFQGQPTGRDQNVSNPAFNALAFSNTMPTVRDFVGATQGTPLGYLDYARRAPGSASNYGVARVAGWTLDPDGPGAIGVRIFVDAAPTDVAANVYRSDIEQHYPAYSGNHGFDTTLAVPDGEHNVCATALNGPGTPGGNLHLGCQLVVVVHNPFGNAELIQRTNLLQVRVRGWAIDPDTTAPVPIQVYLGGAAQAPVNATGSRPDLAGPFPGYGTAHGFDITFTQALSVQVCVYANNVAGTPGDRTLLRCQTV